MATSDRGAAGTGRVLGYLESGKNITGCAAGLVGLGLGAAGLAGVFWPAAVVGLYAAGALLFPPKRPQAPEFTLGATGELDGIREDFAALRAYLAGVELPAPARAAADELTEVLGMLLEPGWVGDALGADPEAVHVLSRAIRQDVPESVDSYVRTRWWTRLQPGTEPPERHLERQLALLREEAGSLASALRESESRRQQTHTHYLESRHHEPGTTTPEGPGGPGGPVGG
ncbi:hypothetical protein [Streptomyces sp. 8L]|uniref:hypothetical protein n=1 Tax=Streptomyces sp. 8L TaxID=2877242 RepID=UPI001CD6FCF3|nr:hypothetical protein [Streptomyces sp. 8L]MCA1219111.1 hypothetical protein [Streptomyces sp. 8L]